MDYNKFNEFIKNKTFELLAENKDYQDKLALYNKIVVKYQELHHDIITGEYYSDNDFLEMQKQVDSFKKDYINLYEKAQKSLFHSKKYFKELEQFEKDNKRKQKLLEKKREFNEYLAEIGDYNIEEAGKELESIKRATIRKVLKDYREEPVVEDVFYESIKKDGQLEFSSFYDNCAIYAYRFINSEVSKVLKRTKYKEKLDDVKNEFSKLDVSEEEKE